MKTVSITKESLDCIGFFLIIAMLVWGFCYLPYQAGMHDELVYREARQ